jgi:hypothetical protein
MSGFWRKCRIAFRCARFTVWVLVLAVIGTFLWFNRVGLPEFIKTRCVATLHERGVDLEFSRLRLSLIRGLVAENVRVGEAGTNNPSLTARQVQLEIDFSALWHRQVALDGLVVRDGEFTLPLSPTNALTLANLQTELRFGDRDVWTLNHFHADFAGAEITLKGEVAHAREARQWKLFAGGTTTDRGALVVSLKNFSDGLQQIHFDGTPQLKLTLSGDARDIHSINAQLEVAADGVHTPWFNARNLQAAADLSAPASAPTNTPVAWGFWTNLQPFRLAWSVRLDELQAAQIAGQTIACAGIWTAPTLAVTNLAGKIGNGRWQARAALDVPSRKLTFTNYSDFDPHILATLLPEKVREQLAQATWTTPPVLQVDGSLRLPPWTNGPVQAPYDLTSSVLVNGELAFTNAVIAGQTVDRLHTRFRYDDPVLELTDLAVAQGRTELVLGGHASGASKNFKLRVSGQLAAATVQGFLTDSNAVHGFTNILAFQQPLALTLDVTGNLRTLETLSATGQIALADFAVRGQTVDNVAAGLVYSNLTVDFLHPQISRAGGTQKLSADKLTLDLAGERIFVVGGVGHADPVAVTRAIGPKTAHIMEPYQFPTLPTARVNGTIPIRQVNDEVDTSDADLVFDVIGTASFRWRSFETPAASGTIRWYKDLIFLTNITAECYGGTVQGEAWFNADPKIVGSDMRFSVTGTNVDLHRMSQALWAPTNTLEGAVSGTVTVTRANSDDWRTWNGYGRLQLRDGLLWDVPIMALMSPLLNAFSAGLGNSRATEATAPFTLTNGVIRSDEVLIRSTMMRLQYTGTVDLQENLDARVTAQLLRNTPVLGSVMSVVLWPVSKIFECQVSGKLSDPKVKPVYMPAKLLLVPLHPLRTLEELFSSPANANAPATNNVLVPKPVAPAN